MKVIEIGQRLMLLTLGAISLLALGACSSGGNDGGDGTMPVATSLAGTFVDSPVQGLGYRATPSGLSGLTDANGQFNYLPGDTVTYNVFGRTIGAAVPAAPVVTALSVFNATSVADPRVLNLSQLLLTLGGIPAGASPITLPAIPPAGFPATLNFSAAGFDTSFPGLTLVSEATAATHLQANFSTVTVALAGSGAGGVTVTSNPTGIHCGAVCSADFPNGTAVTLTPAGAGFAGWSSGCTGTGACVVTLNADTAVTATFTAAPGTAKLTVTTAGTGTGTVTSSPAGINCGATCSAQLVQGTVDLVATAANGSTFAGWTNSIGNASCSGIGTCSILLTVDSSVTAMFRLTAVQVSVSAVSLSANGGGGTVQCSADGGAPGPCGRYLVGTAIVMTATPNAVSNFTGWSGAGAGCAGTGTCSFILTANTTITANFNRPTLWAQLTGTGLVSSNPAGINSCLALCSAPFDKGSLVTLTASGAGFAGWSGGGCAGTGACLVTVDQDSTVTATFQAVGLPPFAQQAYLKGTNNAVNQRFGWSVALDGDTLVVGASGEASCATGINGDQTNTNNSCPSAGAVYVFTRTGGVWSQQAYLKASNTDGFDQFGWSVALSGDTVVVGAKGEDSNATGVNGDQANNSAFNSGAAYVFTRTGGVWTQQAYLKASNTGTKDQTDTGDQFGWSLALSGDTLVVGTPWENSNATGVNGDQANNSAPESGAAYVFTRTGGAWTQQAYLKASNTDTEDQFGWSVALSGGTMVVGAIGDASCVTGINGDQANNACAAAGAAYVFTRTGGVWTQQAYLKASNTDIPDQFGWSVALSNDTLVVGAVNEQSCATGINRDQANNSCVFAGAAYVFTRTGGLWSQQAYLKASNTDAGDLFGTSVALSGDTVVVGAVVEDSCATGINDNQANNACGFAGAAYVFTRTGGLWSQQAYLKASNTQSGDNFGFRVALSGGTLVVGAIEEDSNATGVNGDQADNNTSGSGAAYVFVVQ